MDGLVLMMIMRKLSCSLQTGLAAIGNSSTRHLPVFFVLLGWVPMGWPASPMVTDSWVESSSDNMFKAEGPVDRITVDGSQILNDTRRRQTGINLNYLMDDDRNVLLSPKRTLNEALRELGVKYLRYPGGWKSAINLWSVPPFTSGQPKLLREIPAGWLPKNRILLGPDGGWRIDPYDFDEFLETCRAVDGQPCLVVPYESIYWPAKEGWTPPAREQILETVVAWVHYANPVKGATVKYWEIGNETWLNDKQLPNGIPAATYARDLLEFSRRMKAEDPSILIGANGDTNEWWEKILRVAAGSIDFLAVHSYPCYGWTSYCEYLKLEPDVLEMVRTARKAVEKFAPAHKGRLKIHLTEFAAGSFNEWDNAGADMGHALITFDLQGQLLQSPDVYYSEFWNTHNVYAEDDGGAFDALKRDNSLSPVGHALWIWSHFLLDEMLLATSTEHVRCFATRTAEKQLNLFLVNKDTIARPVRVTLRSFPRFSQRGELWSFHGTGQADKNPKWEKAGEVKAAKREVSLTLTPVSLTVMTLPLGARYANGDKGELWLFRARLPNGSHGESIKRRTSRGVFANQKPTPP
jgi:hypothetical protein